MTIMKKSILLIFLYYYIKNVFCTLSYDPKKHPCCIEEASNISMAEFLDPFEIYGHDPLEKLDHLAHYQCEMMKIKHAKDQFVINQHVHIATDHLQMFTKTHIKELKVLMIALDDVIDNMMTMYMNHNAIKAERIASLLGGAGGPVASEFYVSQEYYCGKNVYLFISDLYSDIYDMGKRPAPYCENRAFYFFDFVHYLDENRYSVVDDPSLVFEMNNYGHGMECNNHVCIFRFPFKKNLQNGRDVSTLPKAHVKCGTILYKLPPLSKVKCIITSGTFILDFVIQGLRYRHYDYMLTTPNGNLFYTKEELSPLICDHHVCEWNYTNIFGGPFIIPGQPEEIIPPWIPSTEPPTPAPTTPPCGVYEIEGCFYLYPPNYGSIAGVSYLDPLQIHDTRFTCSGGGHKKGLYWYPQWMNAQEFSQYKYDGMNKDNCGNINFPPQITEDMMPLAKDLPL